jgi:hypothetical protein
MLAPVVPEKIGVAAVLLKKEGITLFGFLLYTTSDLAVIEYLKYGATELDVMSGNVCILFLIEPPSMEWIEYSRRKNHPWWRLIGKEQLDKITARPPQPTSFLKKKISSLFQLTIIERNANTSIVIGDDNVTGQANVVSLQSIISPAVGLPYNREESITVAKQFGISVAELPCLIFFKDPDERVIWNCPLKQLKSQDETKIFFREFFGSNQFAALSNGMI